MPAYNGIRGYWNEVRVNSNYKSKNAVPQGTELEAGMQTKMEKSRYGFWKPGFLFATLFLQHFFLPDAVWNRRTGQNQ